MANISDVENALVNIAQTVIYPNGIGNPSIAGVDVRIFPGWPIPANLDADLTAGKANVSIFPTTIERNTTRFSLDWEDQSITAATLALSLDDEDITVSGIVSIPQTCMVVYNNTPYSYAVQSNDTIDSVATNIANLIPGASATGAVITTTGAYQLSANISTEGSSIQEIKRQSRVFRITIWAPSDTIRTTLESALDVNYAINRRITMPDLFIAYVVYSGTHVHDSAEKANLYRTDLLYTVEYATTNTETDYTIAYPFANVTT